MAPRGAEPRGQVGVDSVGRAICQCLVFALEFACGAGDTAGGYGIAMRIPMRIPLCIPMRRASNGQVVRAISRGAIERDDIFRTLEFPYTALMKNLVVESGDFVTTSGIYRMNDHPGREITLITVMLCQRSRDGRSGFGSSALQRIRSEDKKPEQLTMSAPRERRQTAVEQVSRSNESHHVKCCG
jgi:hypothetical protein